MIGRLAAVTSLSLCGVVRQPVTFGAEAPGEDGENGMVCRWQLEVAVGQWNQLERVNFFRG